MPETLREPLVNFIEHPSHEALHQLLLSLLEDPQAKNITTQFLQHILVQEDGSMAHIHKVTQILSHLVYVIRAVATYHLAFHQHVPTEILTMKYLLLFLDSLLFSFVYFLFQMN